MAGKIMIILDDNPEILRLLDALERGIKFATWACVDCGRSVTTETSEDNPFAFPKPTIYNSWLQAGKPVKIGETP